MTEHLTVNIGSGQVIAPDWPAVAGLAAKMATVMGSISAVKKDSEHEKQHWSYASYGQVAEEIRKALASAKLALGVVVETVTQSEAGGTSGGLYNAVTLTFTLLDGESGAMMLCPWRGEAVDYGTADRGINKAITSASKYFLMRTFLVSTVDDEDNDGKGDAKLPTRSGGRATAKAETAQAVPASAGTPAQAAVALTEVQKRNLAGFRASLNANLTKIATDLAYQGKLEDLRHECLYRLAGVASTDAVPQADYGQVMAGLRGAVSDIMDETRAADEAQAESREEEMPA